MRTANAKNVSRSEYEWIRAGGLTDRPKSTISLIARSKNFNDYKRIRNAYHKVRGGIEIEQTWVLTEKPEKVNLSIKTWSSNGYKYASIGETTYIELDKVLEEMKAIEDKLHDARI